MRRIGGTFEVITKFFDIVYGCTTISLSHASTLRDSWLLLISLFLIVFGREEFAFFSLSSSFFSVFSVNVHIFLTLLFYWAVISNRFLRYEKCLLCTVVYLFSVFCSAKKNRLSFASCSFWQWIADLYLIRRVCNNLTWSLVVLATISVVRFRTRTILKCLYT